MTTWVFAEEVDGAPSSSALEALSKAREWGGDVAVFYVGTGGGAPFGELGAYGATKVFHLDAGDLLPATVAAAAMADLVAAETPDVIMFGMGNTDRDVAGRLSARLGLPVLSNAVAVDVVDGTVTVGNEILGGTTKVRTAFAASAPALVIARPKAFNAEPSGGGAPEVVTVALPDVGHAGAATVKERHVEASEGPDLEAANVVVSGGRGVGSEEKFAIIEELAGLLGGAVGATRAVVDAGWVPYSLQVGQTGKTVKPGVYLACGISGAMQHIVGMKDSSIIIAINKDSEAPIFGLSDLGVVGDVHKVVPALIEALKAR